MITFCLIIYMLLAVVLLFKGIGSFMTGEGVEGVIFGFWYTLFGVILILFGVIAFIKLYNIHVSFG